MGYGLHRFQSSVDPNLVCGICGSVLEDAVLTPCGHSFCEQCLGVWLARPAGSPTCPECRGSVSAHSVRPIRSLRNLVNNMDIQCEHADRGCRAVVKLDNLGAHLGTCSHALVECAGCGTRVGRAQLPDHQLTCEVVLAASREEQDPLSMGTRRSPLSRQRFPCCTTRLTSGHHDHTSPLTPAPRSLPCEVTDLACRVATLEMQLKRMRRDLEAADLKNRKLERELKRTKEEVEAKRAQLLEQQYAEFDTDYDYGYDPNTIGKLSCLIARFLLKRPPYIDANRTFTVIKRCFDNFSRSGDDYEHDVHMLVATAYASNWFSDAQKLSFHCWLQSIARYRQFSPGLSSAD